jgi:hypothetical protein
MGLYVAGECHLYKNKMNMFMDNGDMIELKENEEEFKLIHCPINHEINMKIVGLTNLDPLK